MRRTNAKESRKCEGSEGEEAEEERVKRDGREGRKEKERKVLFFLLSFLAPPPLSSPSLPSQFLLSFALIKVFAALQKQEREQYREISENIQIEISRNTK